MTGRPVDRVPRAGCLVRRGQERGSVITGGDNPVQSVWKPDRKEVSMSSKRRRKKKARRKNGANHGKRPQS